MQHRMEAVLRKYAPDAVIINYAAYRAEVTPQDGALTFAQLQTVYGTATRAANPAFATQKASPEGEAVRAAD